MEDTNKNGGEDINNQPIEEYKMIQTPNVLKNKYSSTYASVLWHDEQISDPKIEGYIQLLKQKNYISIQTSSNAGDTIKFLKSSHIKLDFLIISGIRGKEIVENIYKDIDIASYFKIIMFGEPEKLAETFKRVKLITNDIVEVEKYISHWFLKLRRRRRFTGEKKDIILPFELNSEKIFKNYGRYLTEWAGIRFNKSEIADLEGVGKDAGVSAEDIKEIIQAYKKENPLRMYSMDTFLFEELNKKLRIQEKNIKLIPFACKINAQLLKNQHFKGIDNILYRGVDLNQKAIGHFQKVAHTDQEIIFPAFTSTSADKEVMLTYFNGNVRFKISFLPNPDIKIYPVSIDEYSVMEDEEEFLFPMGSKFLVQNVIKDEEELIYQIDLLYNGVAYPPVIIDEERAENLTKRTTVAEETKENIIQDEEETEIEEEYYENRRKNIDLFQTNEKKVKLMLNKMMHAAITKQSNLDKWNNLIKFIEIRYTKNYSKLRNPSFPYEEIEFNEIDPVKCILEAFCYTWRLNKISKIIIRELVERQIVDEASEYLFSFIYQFNSMLQERKPYHSVMAYWREKLTEEDVKLLKLAMLNKTPVIFDLFICSSRSDVPDFTGDYQLSRGIKKNDPLFRIFIPDNANITYPIYLHRNIILFLFGSKFQVTNIKREGECDIIDMEYINVVYAKEVTQDDSYIKSLEFNKLIHTNPSDKKKTLELTDYQLRKADLVQIRNVLATETNLKVLNLTKNVVSDAGAMALAEGIAHNASLETLDLSSNEIGKEGIIALFDALKNTSIRKLKLDQNNLKNVTNIGKALANNLTLKELDLSHNKLGDEDVAEIAAGLAHNTSLETLDLSWNKIGQEGWNVLFDTIKSNTSIRELKLCHNKLWKVTNIWKALATNQTLKELDLSHNNLGEEDAAEIAAGLAHNISLETLDLRSNNIGIKGGIALFDTLKSNTSIIRKIKVSHSNLWDVTNNQTLKVLDLSHNKLGDEDVAEIAAGLAHNTSLETLDLSWNNIGQEGWNVLFDTIKSNTSIRKLKLNRNNLKNVTNIGQLLDNQTLKELDLSKNNLGDEDVAEIAAGLAHNTSLETLELSENNIGIKGGIALFDALKNNTSIRKLKLSANHLWNMTNNQTLKELDLSKNNLGDEDAAKIAAGLAHNTSLETLDLSENNIGIKGGIALFDALKSNTSIRKLKLNRNNLKSVTNIGQVLDNQTLRELDLSKNNLGDEDVAEIAAGLAHNTSLETLDLSWNNIGIKGGIALFDALKINTSIRKLKLSANHLWNMTNNQTLKELDLSKNNLGDEDAAKIAAGLAHNTSLETLDLSENNIGIKGGIALFDALKSNTSIRKLKLNRNNLKSVTNIGQVLDNQTLRELDLSKNNLGDEDVAEIAAGLAHNTSLETLDLSWNNIGIKGGIALFDALKINTSIRKLKLSANHLWNMTNNQTLKELDLSKNNLGDKNATEIAAGLAHNTSLETLDLSENSIGKEGYIALLDTLLINLTIKELDLCRNRDEEGGMEIFKKLRAKLPEYRKEELRINLGGTWAAGKYSRAIIRRLK